MSHIAAPRQDAGFTILELLIAITLMGLLTLSLESALRFAAHAWRTHQTQSAVAMGVLPVQTILRSVIEQTHQMVEAREQKLVLLSRLPQGAMKPGLHKISFEVEGGALLMKWTDVQGKAEAQSAVVAKDVSSFALSYREREGDSWLSASRAPANVSLVNVSLSLMVDRREHATAFVAGAPVEADLPKAAAKEGAQ